MAEFQACWSQTYEQHLAFQAPTDQEFSMFKSLQIYSLYLKAKSRHIFLAACMFGFFSANGKLLG